MESDYDYDFEDDPPSNHSLEDLSQFPSASPKKAEQRPKKGVQIEEDQYSDEYESEHDDYEDDFERTLPPSPLKAVDTAKVKALETTKAATVVKLAPKRPVLKTEVKTKVLPKRPPSNESAATQQTSSSQWEVKLSALKASPAKSQKYLETLQKENAELRAQLRTLNAKLNDLVEDTAKHRPAEPLTTKSRAKSEQLKTAEKQIDNCQQEYEVVKARLNQLTAPAYGQRLSTEISNEENTIKQLGKAITAAMKQRRAREKDLERLIVRQETPDIVKQANKLTQELGKYTEKVSEAEREAVRNVKQREDLSEQEEVLTRRVEKLADIASHYQTDEHLEDARRLEEMKSQIDKFSKHVEIVQHSTDSKASRLKA
jgi:DNA repair exonuclease SbcCD ATPase subunit